MTNARLKGQVEFANSRAGQFIGGAWNLATGTVGTIASISYINGSGGTGAALGGTLALQFSLGEMAIGTSQMIDAAFSPKTNSALQSSGSIPGLIAYSSGSQYAPFIDAVGQFGPTLAMTGGAKKFFSWNGLVSGGLAIDAFKQYSQTAKISDLLGFIDQIQDTRGVVIEGLNLKNTLIDGPNGREYRQKVSYDLSYSIKKGDSLGDISKMFNTTVSELKKQNNIKDSDKIKEGQTIKFGGQVQDSRH